jgi:predicted MPP superfamily phosphohydrolase
MRPKIIKILIVLIVILALSIYLYFENTSVSATLYEIKDEDIPRGFDGMKIAQVSDFHNTKSRRLTNKLIKLLNEQDPDLIAITGDLVDCRRTDVDVALKFVDEITKIAPVYYVSGNHEANTDFYVRLIDGLQQRGVIILSNRTEILTKDDEELNLIGINDPLQLRGLTDSERIKTALEEARYNNKNYSILLAHRPEQFNAYVEKDMDLVLTGHAHGGQIRFPFIKAIYAPTQGLWPKYSEGLYSDKNTTMIVSRGIGNSAFPFRINNRPELVIVTLDA